MQLRKLGARPARPLKTINPFHYLHFVGFDAVPRILIKKQIAHPWQFGRLQHGNTKNSLQRTLGTVRPFPGTWLYQGCQPLHVPPDLLTLTSGPGEAHLTGLEMAGEGVAAAK